MNEPRLVPLMSSKDKEPQIVSNGLPFNGEYGYRKTRTATQWKMRHMSRFRYYQYLCEKLRAARYRAFARFTII